MVRIQDYYNFKREQFPEVASALKRHLSVKFTPEQHRTVIFSEIELEKAHQNIPDSAESYKFIRFKLPWNEASMLAYDIGLTEVKPCCYEEADQESKENWRYHMPKSQGTTRTHEIGIFGKEVINCGEYPFQLRMEGDINTDIDHLYLLKSWKEELERNPGEYSDKVIEVGRNAQRQNDATGTALLASLPRDVEEFNQGIREAKIRNDLDMVHCAINMTRFFHDFLGVPLEEVLGSPDSLEFLGLHDFKLSISPDDVRAMCERPTKTLKEVVSLVFPKAQDDLQFTR